MKAEPSFLSRCFKPAAIFLVFGFALSLPAAGINAEEKFSPLFDGKTLEGWTQKGGKAEYTVEGECIVGRTVPGTPNSFLCTKKHYGDFILEYEFKVDKELNSGVQIRSNSFKEYKNGRVHGYQVEIDPDMKRARLWTAGIYEEGRRGWLNDLSKNEKARKAFKPGAWNHIRVEAIGDSIKTRLNGVPAADLKDSMTLTGFIGLQVHGIGQRTDGPFAVRRRNLKIKDLGRHVWKPIFNGKDLEGWTPTMEGTWRVEDGVIAGRSGADEKRHSILLSNEPYSNFTVRVVFKAIRGGSGLYFRVKKVPGDVTVNGVQAEIDPVEKTGDLYETGRTVWVAKPDAEALKKWYKPDDWNALTVSAHGKRIVVHLNGQKTAELDNDPGRTEGYLGLQLHGGLDMHVEFKSLELLVKEKKPPK